MRFALSVLLLAFALGGCGILPMPDHEGRSERIQTMAFGGMLIPERQFIKYHSTPDEQLRRWLYGLTPQQSVDLSRRCIRSFPVTTGRAFMIASRRTVTGCLIWERTDDRSSITIAISDTRLEIYDRGRGEGIMP